MQRQVNYQEATMLMQAIAEALGKGDTPVKSELRATYRELEEVVEAQAMKLDKNFNEMVEKEDDKPILKNPESPSHGYESYKYKDEAKFTETAKSLLNEKMPVEIYMVKPNRKVITNAGSYQLTEFLEYSSVVSPQTAFLLQEYFIEYKK